ncbi:hypothetical protein scyTo_0023670 [Scyliorhinus torazame]|uniref:Par3/HAL N-terminal domain-containing protein n=1 Tax=Scyliorhinus torazame TaxID=75743 RepID=A0A401QDG3_SCYTO|nr:hypothetical protein [Scyliorhinus torazame]
MSRFTVHVREEWLTVPCKDTQASVQWLGTEALRRYLKNKPDSGAVSLGNNGFLVRRCQGLSLLDPDDAIEDVLEDNDFIEVVLKDDVMSSEFIPSQPEKIHLYSRYHEPNEVNMWL